MACAAIVLVALLAAIAGFFPGSRRDFAFAVATVFGALVAIVCLVAGAYDPRIAHFEQRWPAMQTTVTFAFDGLSTVFIAQVFILTAAASVYGVGYLSPETSHTPSLHRPRSYAPAVGLMLFGMIALLTARNTLALLTGWELMALSALFAVTSDDTQPSVREAGLFYLIATRLGSLALVALFGVMFVVRGDFALSLSKLSMSHYANAVFVLALLGFGLKAGLVPLHVWLPSAHGSSPSPVSSLMSGVVLKMGVYGVLRMLSLVEFPPPLWWGITLTCFGAASALGGVLWALGQHDGKRLLAYHSVENIGIIFMGIGIGTIGRTVGDNTLVTLGFAGAIFHTFNHGVFKSLLFFAFGAVVRVTGTKELNLLGGLVRQMPTTTFAFAVGAIAICGLPPLNGFASELFIYMATLHAISGSHATLSLVAPVLAMVGALAVACFTKILGVVFLGQPRSSHAAHAREAPLSMRGSMLFLAAICVLLGVVPQIAMPVLHRAVVIVSHNTSQTSLSELLPLASLTVVNVLVIAITVVGAWWLAKVAPADRTPREPTWGCGYAAPTPRMQYTASSYAAWILGLFSDILRPRQSVVPSRGAYPTPASFHTELPDPLLDRVVVPIVERVRSTAHRLRWLQRGHVHLYLLYILLALVGVLLWRRIGGSP